MSENVTDFGLIAALSEPLSEDKAKAVRANTSLGISYDGSVVFQRFHGNEADATLLSVSAITSFMESCVAAGLTVEKSSMSFFLENWYNASDYIQEATATTVNGRRQIVHGGRTGITLHT